LIQFDKNEDGHISLHEYLTVVIGEGFDIVDNPLPPTPTQDAVDAVAQLRAKFDSIDTDGSGTVDVAELGGALKNDDEFKAMLERSGIYTGWLDGCLLQLETGVADKKITWKEFKEQVQTSEQQELKHNLRAKFDEIDSNKTGKVSKRELAKALRSDKLLISKVKESYPIVALWAHPAIPTGIDVKGRDYVMTRMDVNGDGYLTWEEFDDLIGA